VAATCQSYLIAACGANRDDDYQLMAQGANRPSPSTSVFDACPLIQIKGELRE